MAPTTLAAPHRGPETDQSVGMLLNGPARPRFFQEIQFDNVPTAAGAQHSCRPEISVLSSDVEFIGFQRIREFIHVYIAIRFTLAKLALIPPSSRDENYLPPLAPERINPSHLATSTSLSSGMDNSGRTSPFPICRKNMPDASPSRSK